VADCVIELSKPLAYDPTSRLEATGRFVIVDQYEIAGGGIIRETLPEIESAAGPSKSSGFARSGLSLEARAKALGQKPALVLVSGGSSRDADAVGKALEERLLSLGRFAFFLGMEDTGASESGASAVNAWEDASLAARLGESASLLLDAGAILVVAAKGLDTQDIKTLEGLVAPHPLLELEPSADAAEEPATEDGVIAEAVERLRKIGAF
jgi:bifunctional enzyme CysN/CysC